MSKFIEKIKRTTQTTLAPMGFHNATAQEKPKMLLIAQVTQPGTKNPSIEGADAGFIVVNEFSQEMDSIRKFNKTVPGIPWGLRLKDMDWENREIPECDFIIFPLDMPVFALPVKLGRIMEIDITANDSILRAIEELPVDAVFVDGKPDDTLTWQYMASIQRLDNLISKSILIRLPSGIKGDELPALWRAGVDAAVIDVGSVQASKRLTELRRVVDTTSFSLPRKTKKTDVLLPFIQPAPGHEEEEEEPDEE